MLAILSDCLSWLLAKGCSAESSGFYAGLGCNRQLGLRKVILSLDVIGVSLRFFKYGSFQLLVTWMILDVSVGPVGLLQSTIWALFDVYNWIMWNAPLLGSQFLTITGRQCIVAPMQVLQTPTWTPSSSWSRRAQNRLAVECDTCQAQAQRLAGALSKSVKVKSKLKVEEGPLPDTIKRRGKYLVRECCRNLFIDKNRHEETRIDVLIYFNILHVSEKKVSPCLLTDTNYHWTATMASSPKTSRLTTW